MSTTLVAANPPSPAQRVTGQLKRFFGTIAHPSPLAWVLIGGLSFTITKLLRSDWLGVLAFIPGIYALMIGIFRAVSELKRRAVDSGEPPEYRFWQSVNRRLIRNEAQCEFLSGLSLIAQFGGMITPVIFEEISKQPAPLEMLIACGLVLTLALFTRALTYWYLL